LQAQGGHALLDLQLGRLHPDVGIALRERRHGRRDDAQERRLESGHPHDARRMARGDARQLRLGRLHPVEQRRGVPDEHTPGLGQTHVAPAALEQLRPGLALEHGELLGDRARGVVERPRGAVDGAAGVDLA